MKNEDETFPAHFEVYSLPAAFAAGKLSLLRNNVVPRIIEINSGHLQVTRVDGTVATTRDYADWGALYCGALDVLEAGTTATQIQVTW